MSETLVDGRVWVGQEQTEEGNRTGAGRHEGSEAVYRPRVICEKLTYLLICLL